MATRDRDTPPKADPRRGRNPGYAEDQPRDPGEARRPTTPARNDKDREDGRGSGESPTRR